jgi:hypothetical protein
MSKFATRFLAAGALAVALMLGAMYDSAEAHLWGWGHHRAYTPYVASYSYAAPYSYGCCYPSYGYTAAYSYGYAPYRAHWHHAWRPFYGHRVGYWGWW